MDWSRIWAGSNNVRSASAPTLIRPLLRMDGTRASRRWAGLSTITDHPGGGEVFQIPQAELLREELRQFERRSQRGGASKLAAGTGHDDMVMALALAGWWAYENKSRALSGPELKALDY